jgi:acetyl esterase/lipase
MGEYDFLYDLKRVDFCREGLSYISRIQYCREHPRQYMECIYRSGNGNMPVVIWIHGGGFSDENLTSSYRHEETIARLAKQGYFIACIEYRLLQHAPYPACIEDCQKAILYIKEHAKELNIDSSKIALWGESAGAYIACMAGSNFNNTQGADIQAVVSFYCPSDLIFQRKDTDGQGGIEEDFLGVSLKEGRRKWEEASPITYASGQNPPFLLFHGDVDDLVPYEESCRYYDALKAAGNDAAFVTVEGQGHGFFVGQKYYDQIISFLNEKLRGDKQV